MTPAVVRVRPGVDDVALSALHATAFGETPRLRPWSAQLAAHSLTWLDARDGDALAGFVNVAWDGDRHAFLLDLVVDPVRRGRGIGRALVAGAVEQATAAGCTWLHADFAPDLAPFHRACGLPPTDAGLLRLHR
ncbi:GNAT family N-acetyltransferase [Pseudonocardia spirodelae]|uniref:GNAT family N-acetyltransferase n=1 Tax=Pseudonocardia spirodelae TaxID=3133431 RepID=A0ABU8TF07_9PSEU